MSERKHPTVKQTVARLRRKAPRIVNPRVERLRRALKAVDAERRHDIRRTRQPLPGRNGQTEYGRRGLRAVDERQALLGSERDRLQAGHVQRLLPIDDAVRAGDGAFPDQHEGDVCQRCEIAARTNRTA